MQAMARLPVELLDAVAFFACTDGGRTGCALRLVSKALKDIVEPYRFHSVAISGPPKMKAFLRVWGASPAKTKGSLCHVFLATGTGRTGLYDLLVRVMEATSPYAQTLTITTASIPNGRIIVDVLFLPEIMFPHLTHLTLAIPAFGRHDDVKPVPRFPRVTHVHLALSEVVHLQDAHRPLEKLLSFKDCENLASIRVSGTSLAMSDIPYFLKWLSKSEDDPLPPPYGMHHLPQSVERYIAQLAPGQWDFKTEPERQNALRENAEGGKVKFKVLAPVPPRNQQNWKDIWLEVQSGVRDINCDWSPDSKVD
ncbi:hypothetical protein OE88DRAFT_1725763 [Heliocybe sulcata]|uniref:F-box domain-containing protein n=1 Tax=Heliocybe sulcata TaxID=5364 RepID=A0A5C3N0W0_9AGAM|nr:hypothetical protein OE88DRAFT_1725763 [Heliocybe sulcata]